MTSLNKKTSLHHDFSTPLKNKKSFLSTYPQVDEGVLRCWGMRLVEVGGVQVIGWEVGMGKA